MAFRKGESGNPSTQFRKGESGNSSGRPKGFAEAIKAECGEDYEKLVRAFYLIAFGTAKERVEFFRAAVPVTMRRGRSCHAARQARHRGEGPAHRAGRGHRRQRAATRWRRGCRARGGREGIGVHSIETRSLTVRVTLPC